MQRDNPELHEPERDPTYAILATVVCAGFVTALSLYLIGGLLDRVLPGRDEVGRCDDDDPCPSGARCQAGKCKAIPPGKQLCKLGEPADGCACLPPFEAIDGECQRPEPPAPECDAETITLIQSLIATQTSCKKRLHSDAASCEPGDIREFLLKQREFNTILNKFSTTSWVLVPPDRPKLNGTWPDSKVFSHYLAGLNYDRALLEEAQYILILSHATADKDPRSVAYLQKRLDFGQKLSKGIAGDDVRAQTRLQAKFLAFPIPPDQQVNLLDFKDARHANIIAWSDSAQEKYGDIIRRLRADEVVGANEYTELQEALNRSVTIVPVLCDIPPPAE